MNNHLDLDIAAVPFSRFGSYIAISRLEGAQHARTGLVDGVWLRCVHGDASYEVMLLELVENGVPIPCEAFLTASCLTLRSITGHADVCFPTKNTVRLRVRGNRLRLTGRTFRNHGAIPEPDGNWVFNMAASFRSYRLIPISGHFTMDAPWMTKRCEHMVAELWTSDGKAAEMAIEELTWMRPVQAHSATFHTLASKVQAEFERFCEPFLACPAPLRTAAVKAAYLDWSSVVHANRLLKRPAMYMSKNRMTNVWAWDHAFNALAVCLSDPDLAWDQLMVIFDHQDESGQIPDFVNDVRFLTCFVKPPIHGWILTRMIEFSGTLPPDRLAQAYNMLSRWTDWWFRFRNPDEDGLPVYWHGNDSGWDNGSVFDVTLPLKAPDLAAFLVVQMDFLADQAGRLKRCEEAERWRARSNATLHALLDTLWDGTRFRCISAVTHKAAATSDSVFGCLPIVLGRRLPDDVRKALAAEIRRHLTEWGPATEHPDSSVYDSDGYWRGPIWAPLTMILVDGLRAAGETELARDIAGRFCKLCDKSGFAENFDANTGAPLRDRGYTWTSSVFLVLANKYLEPSERHGGHVTRE